jgi:hypothetical protein
MCSFCISLGFAATDDSSVSHILLYSIKHPDDALIIHYTNLSVELLITKVRFLKLRTCVTSMQIGGEIRSYPSAI